MEKMRNGLNNKRLRDIFGNYSYLFPRSRKEDPSEFDDLDPYSMDWADYKHVHYCLSA